MKNNPKRFRVPSPLQDNILSLIAIVSLIVLTLTAVGAVLWLLTGTGILSYDPTLFDGQPEQTTPLRENNGIFEVLRPTAESSEIGAAPSEIVRFSGSFSTLRTLLSDLQIPKSYQAQFETTLHSGETEVKNTVHIYRSGDAYRIHRFAPGSTLAGDPAEIYICDGTSVVYQDTRTDTAARFPISDSFSAEALAGIPSIASFNEIPDEQILYASYTEYENEIVYYVLYVTPTAAKNRIVHEIWISAESEFVMRCNTYLCGEHDDPMTVIDRQDAKLFSSSINYTAALSDKDRSRLFVLPELPS